MTELIQFLFIVLVPLVLVGGALVTLFAVGALFYTLEHPDEVRQHVDGLFRRPPAPPRTPGKQHYYRPYWSPER
jgi:hypothetical protein